MRLFETIVEANHRAASGDTSAPLSAELFTESLPVIVLSCIDPRLNRILPAALGIPEDKLIWLRNAGNIIFDSMSSMTRTLALACAIKRGREIAIIGHSDCNVGKASMIEVTDRFRALGIDRSGLPDNLNEFFGLFASERQNVLRGCDFVRRSPLIGPKIPVHGLLMDVNTGRLEWLVNGYDNFATVAAPTTIAAEAAAGAVLQAAKPEPAQMVPARVETEIGSHHAESNRPIGESRESVATTVPSATPVATPVSATEFTDRLKEAALHKGADLLARGINKALHYTVVGSDDKLYGPVTGEKLLEWIASERIGHTTQVRVEGTKHWQTLASLLHPSKPPAVTPMRPRRSK